MYFFPYKKLLCILTHTKIYYVVHTQKNCHTFFTMYFFPYKKLLCITRKKNHIQKNVSVFPIQKLLCSAPIQKSHTKKLPYKKNVSVFSTHTKKYYVIHAKKLLVFFPIQKIAIHFFPYKKLLCSALIQKITM